MKNLIKLLFVFTLFTQANAYASNPSMDGGRKLNTVPTIDLNIFLNEKVDVKEVRSVFKENKRVKRLLTPRKKSLKKKYTIA